MQDLLEKIYEQNLFLIEQIAIIKDQQQFLEQEIKQINNQTKIKCTITDFCITEARETTAKYIIKNMPKVSVLNSAQELLTFSLKKVQKEGMFLEFGVFKGSTINHISSVANEKQIFGFDSFEGLPETWRSGFHKGRFSVNTLPEVNSNVTLIKGLFEDSLPKFLEDHKEDCAFIHIDCDLYSSTKTIFELLKSRIKTGTIIVFDEYFNYPSWEEGEFKAFQEFIKDSDYDYRYIGYNRNHQQCAIRIVDKVNN